MRDVEFFGFLAMGAGWVVTGVSLRTKSRMALLVGIVMVGVGGLLSGVTPE